MIKVRVGEEGHYCAKTLHQNRALFQKRPTVPLDGLKRSLNSECYLIRMITIKRITKCFVQDPPLFWEGSQIGD